MPTVVSRISVADSGCQVRSRCSSSSWGRRRMMASIIISTYSAMGSENTPLALVISKPRSDAAGMSTRSTPAVAEWTHARRGARTRMRSNVAAGKGPRSITSMSSRGPSASPSSDIVTSRDPGAAARMRSRSASRYRADRMGVSAMAAGTPLGPVPGIRSPAPGRSDARPLPKASGHDPLDPSARLIHLGIRRQRRGAVPQMADGQRRHPLRTHPTRNARPGGIAPSSGPDRSAGR